MRVRVVNGLVFGWLLPVWRALKPQLVRWGWRTWWVLTVAALLAAVAMLLFRATHGGFQDSAPFLPGA